MAAMHVFPTFDDGPDPVWTPRLLDTLGEVGWRAMFFVIAPLADSHPEIVERMLREGHKVEFHCYRHVAHEDMSAEEGELDARRGVGLLRARFGDGLISRWRPPYGSRADWQDEVAARLGLRLTRWTIDTLDWDGRPAEEMATAIRPSLRLGSILLMHDGVGPGALRQGADETLRLVELLARDGVESLAF
ncbi:MAG: polysaccharide deacetylase family protein [Thermoleophilaceae bacterium]|jgi:peptidoglycan-N-acetylglucosamine deacetylase